MLEPSLFCKARPRPGHLLLERLEEPYAYQGIVIVPDTYRARSRPPFARVHQLAPDVGRDWGISREDTVAIHAAVSKRIGFGNSSTEWPGEVDDRGGPLKGERYLYIATPQMILAGVEEEETHRVQDLGESRQRFWREDHPTMAAVAEGRAEHGATK